MRIARREKDSLLQAVGAFAELAPNPLPSPVTDISLIRSGSKAALFSRARKFGISGFLPLTIPLPLHACTTASQRFRFRPPRGWLLAKDGPGG